MQSNTFVGNLAKAVTMSGTGDKQLARFTLLANEYAGTDGQGNPRQRTVSIQFVAFRGKAKAIGENALKGDQLIVRYRIENNDYEKDGKTEYGYSFIVEDFAFGAPGKEKRDQYQTGN